MTDPNKSLFKVPFPSKGLLSGVDAPLAAQGSMTTAKHVAMRGGSIDSLKGLSQIAITPVDEDFTETHLMERESGGFVTMFGGQTGIWHLEPAGFVNRGPAVTYPEPSMWTFTDNFGWSYGSPDGTGLFRWSGSGNWTMESEYACRYLTSYAGRVFMMNTKDGGNRIADRVRWSTVGENVSFEVEGFNDLVDIGGPITGGAPLGPALFVYKRRAIWRVTETGNTDVPFSFSLFSASGGCVEGKTLKSVRGAHIYLGQDDVYMFNGASAPTPLGFPIRSSLLNDLTPDALRRSFAFVDEQNGEYVLFVAKNALQAPTVGYVYNYVEGVWSGLYDFSAEMQIVGIRDINASGDIWSAQGVKTWDTEPTRIWETVTVAGPKFELVFVKNSAGKAAAYKTNATIPQDWSFTTAWTDMEKPGLYKTVYSARVSYLPVSYSGSPTVRVYNDSFQSLSQTDALTGTFPGGSKAYTFSGNRLTGEHFFVEILGLYAQGVTSIELEFSERERLR